MEQEVNQQTVSIAYQSGKTVGKALITAINRYANHQKTVIENRKQNKDARDPVKQKVKVKDLVSKGGVSNIQLKDDDVKAFEKIARKYGVQYAITKDKGTTPPTYFFFFQAKDTDVIDRAFKEFLGKQMKQEKKTPIKDTLQKFKTIVVQKGASQDKNRNKEHVR